MSCMLFEAAAYSGCICAAAKGAAGTYAGVSTKSLLPPAPVLGTNTVAVTDL